MSCLPSAMACFTCWLLPPHRLIRETYVRLWIDQNPRRIHRKGNDWRQEEGES